MLAFVTQFPVMLVDSVPVITRQKLLAIFVALAIFENNEVLRSTLFRRIEFLGLLLRHFPRPAIIIVIRNEIVYVKVLHHRAVVVPEAWTGKLLIQRTVVVPEGQVSNLLLHRAVVVPVAWAGNLLLERAIEVPNGRVGNLFLLRPKLSSNTPSFSVRKMVTFSVKSAKVFVLAALLPYPRIMDNASMVFSIHFRQS